MKHSGRYEPVQGGRRPSIGGGGQVWGGMALQDRSTHPTASSSSSHSSSSSTTDLSTSAASLSSPIHAKRRDFSATTTPSFSTARPMAHAAIKAGLLFALSTLCLGLLLWIMLPTLDEEHKELLKMPKNFDDLKSLNGVLQIYKERNWWRVLGSYVTVYLFLQAFSIPGSMYMTILGGAMYGIAIALPLACFCVATGALLCYFISSALGPAILLASQKWRSRVDSWKEKIEGQGDNLLSYLIVLRIAPLPPHWFVNILAPHLGITIWQFWVSTFFGISGVSFIHTQIGTTLDKMSSADDFNLISWQNGLGLMGIVVAVMVPVAMRKAWAKDLKEAATPDSPIVGDVRLDDLAVSDGDQFELGSEEDEDEERRIGRM